MRPAPAKRVSTAPHSHPTRRLAGARVDHTRAVDLRGCADAGHSVTIRPRFASRRDPVLTRAQDSVGVAQVVAGRDPRLISAFHDSFMSAMSTACVVVGVLCMAGAVAAAVLLPGRLPTPIEPAVEEQEPVAV